MPEMILQSKFSRFCFEAVRPQQGNFLFLIQEVIKIVCERALQLQNTAV